LKVSTCAAYGIAETGTVEKNVCVLLVVGKERQQTEIGKVKQKLIIMAYKTKE
jgi:hypothetical protein|tara:strand:+ start:4617 stop:4775 length:159 start_codon:yes stop_codon:yes gene_type:complete